MQKGFAPILILVGILVIIGIVSGVNYLGRFQAGKPQVQDFADTQSLPYTSTSNKVLDKNQNNIKQESFQDILSANCRKINSSAPGSFFKGISLDKLPIYIDERTIKIKYREENTVVCLWDKERTRLVSIPFEGGTLYIYDKNSQDAPHNGPSYINFLGATIKDADGTKLGVYLNWPEGGDSIVGETDVSIRGQKILKLSNGEVVYTNMDQEVIKGDNPRLVKILQPYSETTTYDPNKRSIIASNAEQIDNALAKEFFSDISKLQSPERESVASLEKILAAIQLK